MRRILFCGMLLFVVIPIFLGQVGWAQIPQTMSYQGVLTDPSGKVVPDGDYELTLNLYDVAAGGKPLWSETQSVAVSNGVFKVILGIVNPMNLPFDKPYWLAMMVAEGSELTPRLELTSSAYSLNARSIVDSAVTGSKIARGQVVRSINSMTDDVTLAAGENVTIKQEGHSLIISANVDRAGGRGLEQNTDRLMKAAMGGDNLDDGDDDDEEEIVISGGNVGIGTATPTEKLEVVGNIHATGKIKAGNSITLIGDDPSDPDSITTSSNNLVFGGDPDFSNIRVGIGTTGSAYKLDIDATTTFGQGLKISSNGPSRILIRSTVDAVDKKVWGIDAGGSNLSIRTIEDDDVTPIITPLTILRSGNVGIGAATPDRILELEGSNPFLHIDATANARLILDRAGTQQESTVEFQTAGANDWNVGTSDSDLEGDGSEFYIGETLGGASAALWIESGGNVGIGTTSPSQKLEVNGKVSATAFTSNSPLIFEAPAGTERMRIDDITGNVGIGTPSPGAKLDVVSTGDLGVHGVATDSPNGIGVVGDGGSVGVKGNTSSTANFSAGGKFENFAITGNNFGIEGIAHSMQGVGLRGLANNSTGGTGLQAIATATSGPSIGVLGVVSSPGGTAGVFGTEDTGGKILSGFAGPMGGTEVFTVLGSGNVGIGTTSPDFSLDVNGDSRLSGGLWTKFAAFQGEQRLSFSSDEIRVGKNLKNFDFGEAVFTIEGSENANSNFGKVAALGFSNDANNAGQTNALIAKISSTMHNLDGPNRGDLRFFTSDGTLSERMVIDQFGKVGIGTFIDPSFPLHVGVNATNGNGAHVTPGGVWTNGSSRESKRDIARLSAADALKALGEIEPVTYKYKNESDEAYVGFIAEDVPDLVATKDRKHLSPMDIVAVLTKVVQEQQKKIEALEARLNAGQ